MKEYINLLPEKNKNEIREEKSFRNIVGRELAFIFPVILLVMILFSVKLILGIQEQGLEKSYNDEQFQGSQQDLKKYEDKFRETNLKSNLISKVQENHLEWTGVLVKLSQAVPDEVSITGVANKDYQIFLMGRAKNRERLLALKEAVNNSECFTGVNMPLSNLVSKENIDFQMDFEIKKNCLKSQ